MIQTNKKPTVNPTMNVKSYMGKSNTSYTGLLKVVGIVAVIPLVWFLFLTRIIPLWLLIVVMVLVALRTYLIFVLDEKGKKAAYLAIENSQYEEIKEQVKISSIYDGGIILFSDGRMVKILKGGFMLFNDDDKFSEAYERFLLEIPTDYDEVYRQVKNKDYFYNNSKSVKVWEDEIIRKQRFDFYKSQTEMYGFKSLAFELLLVLRVSNANLDKINRFEQYVKDDKSVKNLFSYITPITSIEEVKELLSNDLNAIISDEDLLPKVDPIMHKNIIVGEKD